MTLESDTKFMLEALKEAQKAYETKEVPVGAVLVYQGKIIARGYNQVEKLQDATAHAEMLCMTSASAYLENWRLLETTLYTTLEPCPMCASAILQSRIQRVVWAADDHRLGAGGSWIDLFSLEHPFHRCEVSKGILQETSSFLLKDFFAKRRQNAKASFCAEKIF